MMRAPRTAGSMGATVTAVPGIAEGGLDSVSATGAGHVTNAVSRRHVSVHPGFASTRQLHDYVRRAIDITVAASSLVLLAPLICLIALAIKIDSHGAVFYVQWRTGYRGRRFRMFKFRTMVADAERLRDDLHERNHLSSPDFKIAGDPRITRVGRVLRRSSLDELPQLYNILIGDMSLVGPRPTSFPADVYEPWQMRRLEVKPGLTGLWQISGRSNIDFADRVRLDIHYVERRSLGLDLSILLRTPLAVLRGDGAH